MHDDSASERTKIIPGSPDESSNAPYLLRLVQNHPLAFYGGCLLLIISSIVGLAIGIDRESTPHPNTQPSYPEQVLLFGATPGVDKLQRVEVTWTVPKGASYTLLNPNPTKAPSWTPLPISNPGKTPVKPRVEWGLTAGSLNSLCYADVSSYVMNLNSDWRKFYSNSTSPLIFNSTISGLSPRQRFFYRVGDDANGFTGVIASYAPAAPSTQEVRLAVIGDLGVGADSASTLAHVASEYAALVPPLDGWMLVGDYSYADGEEPVWDAFGRQTSSLSSSLPLYGSVGNHEMYYQSKDGVGPSQFLSYRSRYRSPSGTDDPNKLYYSIDLGLAHFVFLQGYCPSTQNLTVQTCFNPGTTQHSWLVADLAGVDRVATPWVVVIFHQPFVNSNSAHSMESEGRSVQAAIEDVLFNNSVDLALSGHVHALERSCRMYNYSCNPQGITYITAGNGGNREGLAAKWSDPQPPWSMLRQATFGHGLLEISNATHLHWQWIQNPQLWPAVADEVWLVKGQPGPTGPGKTVTPQRRRLQ